ncbi:neurofilament medium polypeptide-like [Haliotis asinina]|uniref:neurofilament medium polypeptide-like n=1 Tax=Haliotis asinina TaxID=109174 RepID=UPI003531CB5A
MALFHIVPADMLRDRAGYSGPWCWQRSPYYQQQPLDNIGFLRDILRPVVVMSHNNPKSESCYGRRPYDTEKCQRVMRLGAQKGECPEQKRQPEPLIASLDFHGFSAEEIKVKVTDNAIIVCGRHDDPGNSFRVTRRLPLPPGVDKTGVTCRYIDGKVILEIPASTNDSVEDKPERQEDEKKAEHKEEKATPDPARTSGKDDDEGDGGMEMEEGMKNLLSAVFGLPVVERKEKKDVSDGSPEKEEQPAEQTTTDRVDPRPDEDNKTTTRPVDKHTDVEEEGQKEKGQEEDTCLMLKYDEKPSLSHDPSDIEEQTTGDSTPPEQTTVRYVDEDEEVSSLMSRGEDDTGSMQVKAEENLPVVTSQDFEIHFDLSNYKPEDIRVVVGNGDVIVEAERENKCDGYSETETLRKRIRLPDKVDQSMLTSVLNSEGEMTIQAPFRSEVFTEEEEKTIPVIWE